MGNLGSDNFTSTVGCGWWGRGAIQTTGPCNFGKLQKALQNVPKYPEYRGMIF